MSGATMNEEAAKPKVTEGARAEGAGKPQAPTKEQLIAQTSGKVRGEEPERGKDENKASVSEDRLSRQKAESAPGQVDLGKYFDGLRPEAKKEFRDKVANVPPVLLAKDMADQGVPADQASSLLQELYSDLKDNPQAMEAVLRDAGFRSRAEGAEEPAPEPLTPDEREMQAALEQEYGPEAERIMNISDKEEREEEIEGLQGRFRDRFGDAAGKTVGKLLKYSTISGGIFAFLLILLLVAHSPSGNR